MANLASDQSEPAAERTEPITEPPTGLLKCLISIAELHGFPVNEADILHGLPVVQPEISLTLLPRAADKIGFNTQLVNRSLRKIPKLVLPCILAQKDGTYIVLEQSDRSGYRIIDPNEDNARSFLSHRELNKRYSGHAVYLMHPDVPFAGEEERSSPRGHWFWSAVNKFWSSYAQIIVAALLVNVLALAVPLFIMNVYDRVIPNLAIPSLWALAVGVAIALFLDFILKTVRSFVIERTGRRVDMAVSAEIFQKLMSLRMKDAPPTTGAMASRVKEFETTAEFFTSSSIVAITDFLFIGIFGFVLWIIVGPLVLVPALAVPLVICITLLVQIPLSQSVGETQAIAAHRHSILVEGIGGLEAIKAAGAEGRMQRAWEMAIGATARTVTKTRFWSSLATNLNGLIQQSVTVFIIVWGVYLVIDGHVTIGALIAASILSGRMLAPLGNITATLSRLQQAVTAMRGITEIMNLPSERGRRRDGMLRSVKDGSVEFKNVSMTYEGSELPALSNVSFRIAAGERVGVMGRIGSGKSTLGRLMAGLYTPDNGIVLVGGADAQQYTNVALRSSVGFAAQEAELFTGTLAENIALGSLKATKEGIIEAGRIAGVEEFAARHPMGYGMFITERGKSLSGGQRQAVSLARILLRRPKLLFLDEPTSSMDSLTEELFVARLKQIAQDGMTLVMSTHKPSLLRLVDRLIVLDQGKLVADGPRDKVIQHLRERAQQPKKEADN